MTNKQQKTKILVEYDVQIQETARMEKTSCKSFEQNVMGIRKTLEARTTQLTVM